MLNNNQESLNAVREIMATAGLTKDMSDSEVNDLVKIAEEKHYVRGTPIILEDSKSRDLYVIVKGRASVRLSLPSSQEKEEIVYRMRNGEIFGELSLVDGSPRSATIKAEDDVITYRLDFYKLNKLLNDEPHIGYLMMRNIACIISSRMRSTNMLWRNSLIW